MDRRQQKTREAIFSAFSRRIKQRIKNGELEGYMFVENYKNIGECLLLIFRTPPFERPIRPHKYNEYTVLLSQWDKERDLNK